MKTNPHHSSSSHIHFFLVVQVKELFLGITNLKCWKPVKYQGGFWNMSQHCRFIRLTLTNSITGEISIKIVNNQEEGLYYLWKSSRFFSYQHFTMYLEGHSV